MLLEELRLAKHVNSMSAAADTAYRNTQNRTK